MIANSTSVWMQAYISPDTETIIQNEGWIAHIRPRTEEKMEKQAGKKPRRWVVERTHSWLNRYRRLLIRWEKRHRTTWGLFNLLVLFKSSIG